MKQNQGKKLLGTVMIELVGTHLHTFLHTCIKANIPLWDVHYVSDKKLRANIYFHHYKKIKQLASENNIEIIPLKTTGALPHTIKLWQKKERLLAILFIIVVTFILTNTVWQVRLDGVTSEMENKLLNELAAEGLFRGAFIFTLPDIKQIENKLLHDDPDLIFLSIEKRGTIFHVRAVEKLKELTTPKQTNYHLIASKNGTIQKMLIKEGQAVVDIYDHVKKGQRLVSGLFKKNEEIEGEQLEEIIIGAEGKVFANTWYELTVEGSLHNNYEKITDEHRAISYLKIRSFEIPIWGKFWQIDPHHDEKIVSTKNISIFKQSLPISFVQIHHYKKTQMNEERSIEQAKDIAIDSSLKRFQQQLGAESQILKYYILHESVHNGKVRLRLYISALENIAIRAPIQ